MIVVQYVVHDREMERTHWGSDAREIIRRNRKKRCVQERACSLFDFPINCSLRNGLQFFEEATVTILTEGEDVPNGPSGLFS